MRKKSNRENLYGLLRKQVKAVMPIIMSIDASMSNEVRVGKVMISVRQFNRIVKEFGEILELPCDAKFNKINTNIIPCSIINSNQNFKEIQVTMNAIYQEQVGNNKK